MSVVGNTETVQTSPDSTRQETDNLDTNMDSKTEESSGDRLVGSSIENRIIEQLEGSNEKSWFLPNAPTH